MKVVAARLDGARLHRVVQPDDLRLFLIFRGISEGHSILLSCRPDFARVSATLEIPEPPTIPLSFGQYARAHLLRSRFAGVEVSRQDRQARIILEAPEGRFQVLVSMLGARSNVYLLDSEDRIVHSVRPLEDTRRELATGSRWTDPEQHVRDAGVDRWAGVPDESYLESIEATYGRLETEKRIETLTRQIENVLGKEQAFLERKAGRLYEDLLEARRAQEYRHKGELLKAALHNIQPGEVSVSATDFETGEVVDIPIDPALSPSENLEKYFGRYQKELRGVSAIQQQIDSLQSALKRIESVRTRLRGTATAAEGELAALEGLAADPHVRRLLHRYYPLQKTGAAPRKRPVATDVPAKLLPKRYRTEQGLEIWVGRNEEGNDYLTTRLARGNDLFFHLEGYPGSHVVLRTSGRSDPPSESVLDACELAVHFSRMKNASRADVHVAQIKDVKKPRGAKPGLVYVLKGKTIHLRRNPKRLEGILASRTDE
jgi:predicted ribosome quality control (RQC) complex YloA/Tae2 family protein